MINGCTILPRVDERGISLKPHNAWYNTVQYNTVLYTAWLTKFGWRLVRLETHIRRTTSCVNSSALRDLIEIWISIFQSKLVIYGWGSFCKIALRWVSLDLTDDKSTLVQGMPWCRQATSLCLGQCWPRSMSPYSLTKLQWVKWAL